ncbi:hypothetical protein CSB69_1075 [Morganella morganii]|nr:hypothetical protein CSB69_1075 [Morganella morganii]
MAYDSIVKPTAVENAINEVLSNLFVYIKYIMKLEAEIIN